MLDVLATIAFASLLLTAAIYDIKYLRIPNVIAGGLVVVFFGAYVAGAYRPLAPHLVAFAVIAPLALLLFYTNVWGGGDTKLLAGISLYLEPQDLLPFLLVTSLVGGVIAAALLVKRGVQSKRESGRQDVPYGAALAAGGFNWCFFGAFS